MAQDDSKYTKPELRERIKKRITAGSKGGKPGQWSARKAQMVASEYKKEGGGYLADAQESMPALQRFDEISVWKLLSLKLSNSGNGKV